MTDTKLTPKFELLVEGAAVPPEVNAAVISIACRQDLAMSDTVEVRLSNNDLRYTEGETFAEGKKLSVKLGYVEKDLELVATGEIVRRECEFPERGPAVVTIVALDKEFRLKHGKKSRVFKDMKDSDIVSQICGEASLSGDVEATQVQHKYVFQINQTNLEFIRERARRCGYIVQVDRENAKLTFKKPQTGEAAVVKLKWGETLLSFRPRYSIDDQFQQVEVRGWDMTQKKEISSKAAPSAAVGSKMGASRLGADLMKKQGGKVEVLYPDVPMFSTQEAEQMALAYANQLLQSFVDGEGSGQGENKLVPGKVIEIDACGKRANGSYYVTATLHHYESKGYTTYFSFMRPSDTAKSVPPPPPPPTPPPPTPTPNEDKSWAEFNVTVGDGVPFAQIQFKATGPDGTVKSGALEPGGKIRLENMKKPGDATFELTLPKDVTAFQPGKGGGGGAPPPA